MMLITKTKRSGESYSFFYCLDSVMQKMEISLEMQSILIQIGFKSISSY